MTIRAVKLAVGPPEAELNARFNRDFSPKSSQTMEPELAREAKVIAKSILKEHRIKPTREIIEKVIAMPGVRELALDHLRRYNEAFRILSEGRGLSETLGSPLVRVWPRAPRVGGLVAQNKSGAMGNSPAGPRTALKRTRHWRRVSVREERQCRSILGSVMCRNSHTERKTLLVHERNRAAGFGVRSDRRQRMGGYAAVPWGTGRCGTRTPEHRRFLCGIVLSARSGGWVDEKGRPPGSGIGSPDGGIRRNHFPAPKKSA